MLSTIDHAPCQPVSLYWQPVKAEECMERRVRKGEQATVGVSWVQEKQRKQKPVEREKTKSVSNAGDTQEMGTG